MRLVLADIKSGFWSNRYKYVLLCACFAMLSMQFLGAYHHASTAAGDIPAALAGQAFTGGDVFMSYFAGLPPPLAAGNLLTALPFGWLAFQVVIAAIVGYYPVRSGAYDTQLYLRAGSRLHVSLSRVLWMVLAVGAAYALALIACLLTALFFGSPVLAPSPAVASTLVGVDLSALNAGSKALVLILPCAASLAVSAAQVFIARELGPVAGVIAVSAYSVASVFVYALPLLPGAAMLARSVTQGSAYLTPVAVLSSCAACFVLCTALFVAAGRKGNLFNPPEGSE